MSKHFTGVRYTGPHARLVERCVFGVVAMLMIPLLSERVQSAAHAIVDAVVETAGLLAAVAMIVAATALIASIVFEGGDAAKALPAFGRLAKRAVPAVVRAVTYPLRAARDAWRSSGSTTADATSTTPVAAD